jgi:HEAT repeat protein
MGLLDKLFGPPDIAKLKASGNLRGLLKATDHKDAAVREQAAAALASLGPPAVEFLVTTLHDFHEAQRRSAATMLGKLNWTPRNLPERIAFLIAREDWAGVAAMGEEARPLLMAYVIEGARPQEVRTAAVAALGVIGNPACVGALAQVSESGPTETACVANLVLGRMGQVAAERMLLKLRSEGLTQSQYIDAAQCLGDIGEPAVELLVEAAKEIVKGVQATGNFQPIIVGGVVFALAGCGDPRALEALRKISDGVPAMRGEIEPLWKAFHEPPSSLIQALTNSNPGVRMVTAMALGHLRAASAVAGLTKLLADQHPPPRVYAAVSLGKIGGPAAAQALLERLERVSRDERVYILMALSECREPSAIPRLAVYQKPPHDFVHRALATLAIAKIRAADAVTVGR